ncbi:MAG: hypothetical protein CMN73_09625 [Sphingomonas sp.]|nr:hypothetical protein [Sphingomonas sp.]
MTSRELTGLLTRSDDDDAMRDTASSWLWRIGFGAISWPWLLASLSGGRQSEKQALLAELDLPDDALPHLGSWKADVGFLRHIAREISSLRPAHVVELGAGASSLIAARALALHGGGKLHSFDQHGDFVTATRQWLSDNGMDVDIRHAPLTTRSTDWPGRWYSLTDLPDRIDMIIIDGPPWSVHPLVRGAADGLFTRLAPNGVILLDDGARPGERLVARRWRRRWPDIDFRLMRDGTKRTLIGRKRDARSPVANDNEAGHLRRRALRIAMATALIASGWIARGELGPLSAPAHAESFVDEAVDSHRTGLLRQAMASQLENTMLDPIEITRSTGITLPTLPAGWILKDVQLYPTTDSPAVALSLISDHGEQITLFADRTDTLADAHPLLAKRASETVAYWENGDAAFAVAGQVAPERALELAAAVARSQRGNL